MLTEDEITSALPKKMKGIDTAALAKRVNQVAENAEERDAFRENFMTYSGVLKEGKYSPEQYISAVMYCSYRLMGHTQRHSYITTFPDRYKKMVAAGYTREKIGRYIFAFNKTKLVNLIMEQSMIPSWVLNQDMYQKALNTQVELMQNAKSEKVRSDAANSILTHLKRPEAQQVELNIGVTEHSGMDELKSALRDMARQQRDMIGEGVSTKSIAQQKLIQASNEAKVVNGSGSRDEEAGV